ncbi:MAG: glycosyltransferase [Cyclobacteriaceae bacterium]|nr:glycosyltransferase [Cyclobacteriaceae bacterium]
MPPLVSVICLSYNHARFVVEALDSVLTQSYQPVELLVVDDASTDGSAAVIREWLIRHPHGKFFPLAVNGGNCKAFNTAFRQASGKYVIDLSADDVLLPSRIERGVRLLESRPEVGVQFSDAELIDEKGRRLGYHSDRFPHHTIPQGMIFRDLLSRYFINSPTMMIRKSVLDELGGYDETLAYEDFDFWVRSALRTQYAYIPEALVRRRVISTSMGKQQHRRSSLQAWTTLRVCEKAFDLCQGSEDLSAWRKRIVYEGRLALGKGNLSLAWKYVQLWRRAYGN